MKLLLILLLLLPDPIKLMKINKLKSEAQTAFQNKNYKEAAAKYRILRDSLGVNEEAVTLDLAHSYFQLHDTAQAPSLYQSLSASAAPSIRSIARQQLGVLADQANQPEKALEHFKESLKADPDNEDARYNYELVKKKLDDKKKENKDNKDDKNKDKDKDNKDDKKNKDNKDNKDEKDKDKKDNKDNKDNKENKDNKDSKDSKEKKDNKEKENKDGKDKENKEKQEQKEKENQEKENKQGKEEKQEQSPSADKLKQMKMSEAKAKMILEAMKNQEVQYLQQNRRQATKPRDKDKPDW